MVKRGIWTKDFLLFLVTIVKRPPRSAPL
jgi:hypothetical protein